MKKSKISLQDYENALQSVANYFVKADDSITPISIIQNGNIGTVGVSDIDLVFIFPDAFEYGKEFAQAYSKAISEIAYKEVFFIHSPMVLSESMIKYLPEFTFNPANELRVILGKEITFLSESPNEIQSLLISLEFIQFRLFQLMNMYGNGSLNQHGLLLRGHSMKHSITLAKKAGISLNSQKFSAFQIVEKLRESITNGKPVQLKEEEIKNLARGIINDFKILYQLFAKKAEQYVSFYLPYENKYEYEENVYMTNLFESGPKMQSKVEDGKLMVEGIHWINMLLRDVYFGTSDSTSIIIDDAFKEQCENRAEFHKKQWEWNIKVFGNIHAGLSPKPAVIGNKAEAYANLSWGI